MKRRICISLLSLTVPVCALAAPDVKAEAGLELTGYSQSGAQGQTRMDASLRLLGQADWAWNGRQDRFTLKPFYRADRQDDERTHSDLREAVWTQAAGEWQHRAGIGQVFWGVTEGAHLVDIVNQTDTLENPEGDARLGQPLLNAAWERDSHLVDVFVLPGFRTRPYAGFDGRLRLPWVVDTDHPAYESGRGRRHVDIAARYQFSRDGVRLGLSAFRGTSREPELRPMVDFTQVGPGGFAPGYQPVLQPYYPLTRQIGLDAQITRGDWLWKLEAIDRDGFGPGRYQAANAGFEYTQVGVFGSRFDLGWLGEGLYDSRDTKATTPFARDILLGWRLAFNDAASSDLLLVIVRDTRHPESYTRLKGSTRLNDRLRLSLESRLIRSRDPQSAFDLLAGADTDYPLRSFADDSHVRAELTWYY